MPSDVSTDNKVRLDPSKYDYKVSKDFRTSSGRSTIDNDDRVASALRGMTLEGVFMVLTANGGEVNPAWQPLNPGMQRMAAGNVLRRIARKLEGEQKELVLPDEALATITKVDPEAAKAAREAKAAEAKAAAETKALERQETATKAKAEREQKAATAKAEREEKAAVAKAEREAKAEEARLAKAAAAESKAAAAEPKAAEAGTDTDQPKGRRKKAKAEEAA